MFFWQKMSSPSLLLFFFTVAAMIAVMAGENGPHFDSHGHNHGHHHHQGCQHHDNHHHHKHEESSRVKLPEEIAEEEDLKLLALDRRHHQHDEISHAHQEVSGLGVWVQAMGCSMLVSMASLVCLLVVPVFFLRGKPSKAVVDSLAVFGAGAMLGDAFLHQLPHAFSGEHSHSHDHHHLDETHVHHAEHRHSHSLKDLSVGLSVLSGIVLFLIVEKIVRYVEEYSGKGAHELGHGHHHHHKKHIKGKEMDDNDNSSMKDNDSLDKVSSRSGGKDLTEPDGLQKRSRRGNDSVNGKDINAVNSPTRRETSSSEKASSSSLVLGYLNLFSDGVHNFTDGMALGSAFLIYGTVGGWSRTLFLLAHELPQEVGDFGILVRSGFSVSKALFFNFLSALVALVGTALALVLGKDPGQSSLIEGFTAGGFIYIAVAGVLPELNNGATTLKSTMLQLTSLIMGMGVALCISLVE